MQLPITRPSRMSYADELNFSELLGELKSNRFNGFIRVTSGSLEGYILFNEGKQVAASYGDYSKVDAIENIKVAIKDSKTLIEVFDIRESQIKYFMDMNKHYLISIDPKFDVLDELQKSKSDVEEKIMPTNSEPSKSEMENIPEPEPKTPKVPEEVKKEPEESVVAETSAELVQEEPKAETESLNNSDELKSEKAPETEIKPDIKEQPAAEEHDVKPDIKEQPAVEEAEIKEPENIEEIEFIEPGVEAEAVDRAELMKKYGLKDVGETEVDNILETYKGGSLSDEDIEKVELTLMNKIKKSILGIPKIKGTEVMVFLDNSSELTGNINIITEYESKGFLSRIVGDSKGIEKLRKQIINITQIEIKKSFRGYPEIVDDFEINVEIS
ncbi:MAG: DUF4388 domain-containing protein [Methanobacterium sp.]|uniref:DUF2226 domain-containing protein n=1 Tax=Methanobacterium sp. TaxID=2164 RepID=UPI003D64E622|nr:DUF4388 domain-containing protein [Methanobacterium sp.]